MNEIPKTFCGGCGDRPRESCTGSLARIGVGKVH